MNKAQSAIEALCNTFIEPRATERDRLFEPHGIVEAVLEAGDVALGIEVEAKDPELLDTF
jgi:hypothetical protein